MSLPRKTDNATRYARLASRGVLTRLAMYFHGHAEKRFSGAEVSRLLVEAVTVMGSPDSAFVIRETPPEVVEERMQRIAPLLEAREILPTT
jgi:hypothetical protein